MARARPISERQQTLNRYLDEFDALITQGLTYRRARARFLRDHPDVSPQATSTLDYLEREIRFRRRAQGMQARRERMRYHRELHAQQAAIAPEAPVPDHDIAYDPNYVMGVSPSHIEVRWVDPRTGADQYSRIFAPILLGASYDAILSMVAGLIAENEGSRGYHRKEAIFLAVRLAARTGGLTINGEVRRQ